MIKSLNRRHSSRVSHFDRWVVKLPRKILWIGGLTLCGLAAKPAPVSNASMPQELREISPQPQAVAPARATQRLKQERQVRPENYDLSRYPVIDATERHWRNILWTTAIVNPQEPFVADAMSRLVGMTIQKKRSAAQSRTIDMAMQIGTQLYLSDPANYAAVGRQFWATVDRSPEPQWVAMALSALVRAGLPAAEVQQLRDRVRQRFPNWAKQDWLLTTLKDIDQQLKPAPTPPLADLLKWSIAPRQPHLYVLCSEDRHVLCRAILKDSNGEFLREADPTGKTAGRLWSIPLLLRSINNLSWNFFRGNTPQGIYRIQSLVTQSDDEFFRAYGQFPLVQLFMPLEAGVKEFLPGQAGKLAGGLETYRTLLPPTWRNHWGLQESYWAGKIGRSLLRIHGSGESPDFFSGKDGYPDSYNWNPTIGCLSALETYNGAGKLIQADIPKLLKALIAVGGNQFTGYLVVVDLPRQEKRPIGLNAIELALNPAWTPPTAASPPINPPELKQVPRQVTGY
jgi:hypothetical protein